MEGMIMTAQLLLSLSILIVVHEWGHFITARIFNIKVEKFYLFFDFLFPMANVLNFSLIKFKKGDTEYGIGWFPLGGYVKIAGMVDESMDKDQMKGPPEPWEFRGKPAWQRLIVMLGGVIVNVVVGIIIFIAMLYSFGDQFISNEYVNNHGGVEAMELASKIGLKTGDKFIEINGKNFKYFEDIANPDALLSQDSYYTVLREGKEVEIAIPTNFIEEFNKKGAIMTFVLPRRPAQIESVADSSLAKSIGLQKGDLFVEIQGKPINYFDELRSTVKDFKGDSLSFKIKRGSQILSFNEYFKGKSSIGFYSGNEIISKDAEIKIAYGLGEAIVNGPGRAFKVVTMQLKAFRKMFTNQISVRKSLSSPIGIAKAYGGKWDWQNFWRMTGVLSMVLAFMNLLPIPGLDGGYVVFLLYEMVSGREPNEKVFETSLKIGMAILLCIMIFAFYNDISKMITGN